MATMNDFDGFDIRAMNAAACLSPADDEPSFTEEEFFANFGINPDGTPLRRDRGMVSSPAPISREFAEAQKLAIVSLELAKRDLEGLATASLIADLAIARAAVSIHSTAVAATRKATAVPRADLLAPSALPAADAGPNLTPRIFPTPRT